MTYYKALVNIIIGGVILLYLGLAVVPVSQQPVDSFAAFKIKRMGFPGCRESISLATKGKVSTFGAADRLQTSLLSLSVGAQFSRQDFPLNSTFADVQTMIKKLDLCLEENNVLIWDEKHETLALQKNFKVYSVENIGNCNRIKKEEFDVDGDGLPERYSLQQGKLTVNNTAGILWQTPNDWWVEDFVLGDINNDGIINLILSVWKPGNFGSCKPFWVTEEDNRIKNHLFIFKLVDGSFKPLWQSSNLKRPNYRLALIDIGNDGRNLLLVLEGDYTFSNKWRVNIWQWNGWGFTCLADL